MRQLIGGSCSGISRPEQKGHPFDMRQLIGGSRFRYHAKLENGLMDRIHPRDKKTLLTHMFVQVHVHVVMMMHDRYVYD